MASVNVNKKEVKRTVVTRVDDKRRRKDWLTADDLLRLPLLRRPPLPTSSASCSTMRCFFFNFPAKSKRTLYYTMPFFCRHILLWHWIHNIGIYWSISISNSNTWPTYSTFLLSMQRPILHCSFRATSRHLICIFWHYPQKRTFLLYAFLFWSK